jgi:hypothetical protein
MLLATARPVVINVLDRMARLPGSGGNEVRIMSFGTQGLRLWPAAAAVLLLVGSAAAGTVSATNCSASSVQAAIAAARDGDTVDVPAGTCNWSSTTVAIPSAKTIVLTGAGIDATTITTSAGTVAIRVGDTETGGRSRVTGFTLKGGYIVVDGDGWRVDHLKIVSATTGVLGEGVFASGLRPGTPYGPTGLIDHVTFNDTRVLVYGFPDVPVKAATLLSSALGLGDANAVYVEDSTFTFHGEANVIDCNYGGRYVFRHNTVSNSSVDAHSVQGWNRGCRRWEIYDNAVQLLSGGYFTPFFIRGGTGVIFNNTITGNWSEPFISFDNVRSFESRSEWFPVSTTAPGACNGSSSWDGNQASNGWPCRDQIGRGGDNALWTSSSPFPTQSSVPAYIWNNTINGATATVRIRNDAGPWIQAGRDYIQNAGPKPGYTSLAYPHPLTRTSPATPPAAPSNLTVR